MSIRVLMFGWEFPPHIAGGLGTACYGLTKGLANHDIQILFVMPKAGGDEDQSAVRIINASDVEMLEHIPGQNIRWENVNFMEISSNLVPYMTPDVFEKAVQESICTKENTDKISFTKLLGTLVVDRVSDTIMVGTITLFIFLFNIDFFTSFFANNPALVDGFRSMFNSIWIYVLLVGMVVVVWLVFKYMSGFKLVRKARGLLDNIWMGMKSIWLLDRKWLFLLDTFLIWGGYFCYFYITFYAFGFTEDLGVVVGLIAFTMSSIGVAVPVQGGIGPWHFMVIATLVCFGVNENDAAAFALVVHTVQTVWTGLCGLFGIVAIPLNNRKTAVQPS